MAVFDFLSRIVKMLYRQFQRRLSDRGGWFDLREKFSLYYIVIFYKIKYIFSRIQKPRAPACEKTPISQFHNFTFSHFHTSVVSPLILTFLLFEHFSLTWI